jgi:AAA15 family ATPase/GTPase
MNDAEEEKKFGSRRQPVSLKNLYLDTNNYRFIDSKDYNRTDSSIINYTNKKNQSNTERLIRGASNVNIKDLIESFKTNGFVDVDQIQVRELESGKFLVLEGNRRVATLKFLESEYKLGNVIGQLDPKIFSSVPVVIYRDDNEQQHRILMGLKHINGNKRWPAINQAQLLQDLKDSGMSEKDIINSLGITKLTYSRYIYTLQLVNDYKNSIYGDQFETVMFNIFAEITRKPELMSWLSWNERQCTFDNTLTKNRLFSWLSEEPKTDDPEEREDGDITDNNKESYSRIIKRGADIRDLAQFINDEDALLKMEETRDVDAGLRSSDILNEDKFNSTLESIEKQLGLAYNFSKYAKPNSKIKLHDLNKKITGLIATQEGSLKTETKKTITKLNSGNISQHFSEVTIENYKAFKNVEVKNLRQINLFAGVNNAGKSTLLEAIFFLVKQNDVFSFFDMYRRRGKFTNTLPTIWLHENLQESIDFSGKFNNQFTNLKIRKESDYSSNGNGEGNDTAYLSSLNFEATFADEKVFSSYDLYEDNTNKAQINELQEICNISYSSPFSTADGQQLSELYNQNIKHLFPIIEFIQMNIDSKFKDIRINTSTNRFEVVHSDFENNQDLTQFGDGLQRVFHIALQFAAARNGVVLIDEIENAIHHSLFKKLIPFIKQLSEKFNVQVFITSHSKECIDAFFEEDAYNDKIAIYNLSRSEDGNIVCKYDSGELFGELIELINADARGGDL